MKNQTFGIELETTGIGRERTAKALAAHFGTTAVHRGRHLDDWVVPMPDGRHWTVESDASINGHSRGLDAEVVSPVCRWDDIPMVQEVARVIRAAGGKADDSCGIHVHVGLGEHFLREVNRVKPTSMEAFAKVWYTYSDGSYSDWRRCAGTHYDHSRYHLLYDKQVFMWS